MRILYDPQDFQEVARLVTQSIMPLLVAEIQAAMTRQAPPVPRPEPAPNVQRAVGEVLKAKEVLRLIGVSETTLWRLRQAGGFPSPLRLSSNRIGWKRSEIEAWQDSRR